VAALFDSFDAFDKEICADAEEHKADREPNSSSQHDHCACRKFYHNHLRFEFNAMDGRFSGL
jgi:hypothetical protein